MLAIFWFTFLVILYEKIRLKERKKKWSLRILLSVFRNLHVVLEYFLLFLSLGYFICAAQNTPLWRLIKLKMELPSAHNFSGWSFLPVSSISCTKFVLVICKRTRRDMFFRWNWIFICISPGNFLFITIISL